MTEFCELYLPRIYRFALRRLATPEDADDVVQMVLSNAARRIETFRGQSTLQAWLMSICSREISKLLGEAARRPLVSLHAQAYAAEVEAVPGPSEAEPAAVVERQRMLARVRDSLDRLPERQALVLELKYVEGYSSREIARRLEISDDAVQSLLARARRSFREICDVRMFDGIEWSNGE